MIFQANESSLVSTDFELYYYLVFLHFFMLCENTYIIQLLGLFYNDYQVKIKTRFRLITKIKMCLPVFCVFT